MEILEGGAGMPLVFLHSAYGLTWSTFHEELTKRYQVAAPYIPDTGQSTGLINLNDHHDLFFMYLELFDALGHREVNLIGHSLGGWIAAELAALAPERIQKLILISPLGLWNDNHPVADFLTIPPSELMEASFYDTNLPEAQAIIHKSEDPAEEMQQTLIRAHNRNSAGRFLWPIPDKGLSRRIHRIKAPTTIFWGIHDQIAPVQYAEEFQRSIDGSQVVQFQQSSHNPHIEESERALNEIYEFLS